jgi:hypothetical protein
MLAKISTASHRRSVDLNRSMVINTPLFDKKFIESFKNNENLDKKSILVSIRDSPEN